MTKQEIQAQINELQKQLDKCPDVAPFTCKGQWHTGYGGQAHEEVSQSTYRKASFNYWQTQKIAEKAYQLQLCHRKMLSFISQYQELGEGEYYIYKSSTAIGWHTSRNTAYFPDVVTMTKETADKMLKALENGSLDLL